MANDPAALLARARAGDSSALEQLLVDEHRFLLQQVQRNLDAALRSRFEPEDLLQEARLRVVRSLETADFANVPAFRGWLAAIVRHVAIDLRRRQFGTQKRQGTPRSLEAEATTTGSGVMTTLRDRLQAREPGPSSIVRRKEDLSLLEQALAELKPHHREILRQVHFERLRLNDIAARQGRKPATVRKELARALVACREVLDRLRGGQSDRSGPGRSERGTDQT